MWDCWVLLRWSSYFIFEQHLYGYDWFELDCGSHKVIAVSEIWEGVIMFVGFESLCLSSFEKRLLLSCESFDEGIEVGGGRNLLGLNLWFVCFWIEVYIWIVRLRCYNVKKGWYILNFCVECRYDVVKDIVDKSFTPSNIPDQCSPIHLNLLVSCCNP